MILFVPGKASGIVVNHKWGALQENTNQMEIREKYQ